MTSIFQNYFSTALDTIFSEYFWLPRNVSWKDFENPAPGVFYPTFRSLWNLPVYTLLLLTVRYLLESVIFKPMGRYIGLKDSSQRRLESNSRFETVYRREKRPSDAVVKELAEAQGCSVRQVERWFRVRRNNSKSSPLTKFSESGWRFSFYSFAGVYGACVLWNKSWLTDQRNCWIGHPFQNVTDDIFIYYMIELAFYASAVISIFIEVRRKDFWQMFIHHIATIMLVSFSWITNFVRVGSLIFLVHDVADPWMELAKLMKYSGNEVTSILIFVVFTIVWIVTRLYFYPFWLLNTVLYDTRAILEPFYSLWMFVALLMLLQVLHIIWTVLILKIPYRMIVKGDVNDSRSDSEMESFSGEENGSSHQHSNKNNNNNSLSYANGTKGLSGRSKVE